MKAALARLVVPCFGGLLLAAATPPAWFPGAEWLVLFGLAVWFVLATDTKRPLWHSYLFGCVHMAWFSWSVRHVLFLAYALIIVLGGCYYLLASAAVRSRSGWQQPLGFALAVAAAFWLRAVMPEICYPHGQPCHALWQWPVMLHCVVVGSEPLANALLAAVAATLVGVVRSWRVGRPRWSRAVAAFAVAIGAWVVTAVVGHVLLPVPSAVAPTTVRVAAVEPGYHLMHEWVAVPEGKWPARLRELIETRLVLPTRDLLARSPVPDVVLWPESSLPDNVRLDEFATVRLLRDRLPVKRARLVLGANVKAQEGGLPTPAALMIELGSGRILAHQEKQCLVPGGEFQPFLGWLPKSVGDALRSAFAAALGSLPETLPGRQLPPLTDANGVPFGAMLCYDNAFPGPAAAQVAMGARWLAVLSNETWYEGGGELTQLMAMTVVRALETGTPFVRCTQDGWSGFVDGHGRLRANLALAAPAPRATRILLVDVPLGAGRLPPMAWLRAAAGPVAACALALLLLHAGLSWARLRAARTASRSQATLGFDPGGHGSGS